MPMSWYKWWRQEAPNYRNKSKIVKREELIPPGKLQEGMIITFRYNSGSDKTPVVLVIYYDQLLKVNEENERELVKAEKYEGLYNAKEESWALMLDSIREKNRVAEEKAGLAEEKATSLGKEKEQLQLLCDRLQAEMKLLPAEA